MFEDRADAAKADEDDGGGIEQFLSAGKLLRTGERKETYDRYFRRL